MKYLILSFFALFFVDAFGQSEEVDYWSPDSAEVSLEKEPRLGLSFSAGASVGVFNDNVFSSRFVAPRLSYSLNDRTRIFGGVQVIQGTFPAYFGYYPGLDAPNNPDGYGLTQGMFANGFAGMSYDLNPDLSIYGMVFKNFAQSQGLLTNPYTGEGFGYAAGFEYKVNESMSFGVQVSHSTSANPYSNPFAMPGAGMMNPLSPVR